MWRQRLRIGFASVRKKGSRLRGGLLILRAEVLAPRVWHRVARGNSAYASVATRFAESAELVARGQADAGREFRVRRVSAEV